MKARASARDLKSLNEKKIRNDKKKKKEDKNEDRRKDLEREREENRWRKKIYTTTLALTHARIKAERLLPNDFRKFVQRRIYYFILKRSI